MKTITTLLGINLWLSNHGDGIGVSWTQGCFTVFCQTGHLIGGARILLGSGRTFEAAIEHAEVRMAELKASHGMTPLQFVRQIQMDYETRLCKPSRRRKRKRQIDDSVEQACPGGIPK